eukprot:735396-Prymnesium_polylepis.1
MKLIVPPVRHCTHDVDDDSADIENLTFKSAHETLRVSVCDLSEVYRPQGRPLSTSRPGEDAEALK